jgi:hypothetical protein
LRAVCAAAAISVNTAQSILRDYFVRAFVLAALWRAAATM